MKAVIYRNRKQIITAYTIFLLGAVLFSLIAGLGELSEVVIVAFFIVIYLALRVPLAVFARSAESVEVDVIVEVEVRPVEVFRAMILYSRAFLIAFTSLIVVFMLAITARPQYAILPLNMLILLVLLTVFRNTRLRICKQGVVDSGGTLFPWGEFFRMRVAGGLVIFEKKLGFPVVLPEREDVVKAVKDFLDPEPEGKIILTCHANNP